MYIKFKKQLSKIFRSRILVPALVLVLMFFTVSASFDIPTIKFSKSSVVVNTPHNQVERIKTSDVISNIFFVSHASATTVEDVRDACDADRGGTVESCQAIFDSLNCANPEPGLDASLCNMIVNFAGNLAPANATTTIAVGGANSNSVNLGLVGDVLKYILFIFLYIFGMFIKLGAFLVAAALTFNQSILTFDPPFIITGWTIFRDIANLGFVFGIIIVAIATILRIKSYRAQSILWKLIVAALLVNFSLVIAGSFIKTSDVFSNYFLESIGGGSTNEVALRMVNTFNIDKLNVDSPPDSTWAEKIFLSGPSISEILGMMVGVIIEALIFVVFLLLAVMLLLRYFYLSFLLLISPMVWLLWIFPTTNKYWKEWWSTFIHWVIFSPMVLMFVWLTLKVMENSTAYYEQTTAAVQTVDASGAITGTFFGGVDLGFIMSSIMAMALLIGGIKISLSFSLGGTKAVLGVASKAGNWTKGKAGRGIARIGNKTGLQEKMSRALSSKKIQSVPLLNNVAGAASRRLAVGQVKTNKAAQGHMEDFKKSISTLGEKKITELLPTMRGEKRAAALEHLASKNKLGGALGEVSTSDTLDSIRILKKKGKTKEASEIEKKFMSEDALVQVEKVKSANNETERDEATAELKKIVETNHEKFSAKDWASYAKNMGGSLLSIEDGSMEAGAIGIDEASAKALHESYIQGIKKDLERALGATVPKLKDKQIRTLYGSITKELVSSAGDIYNKTDKKILDSKGNPISKTEKIDINELLNNANASGDYSEIYEALEKSENSSVRATVKKMRSGMSSLISGESKSDKNESKNRNGKDNKKEKKDELKNDKKIIL